MSQIGGLRGIIPPIELDCRLPKWDVTEENPMSPSPNQPTSIQVMSRMFSLLDTLALGQEAVSLKYISAQTGLHPSTAHRILNDLAAGRYVERAGPGSYRLGLRLLELGNLVRGRLDLREEATAAMQDLHRLLASPVSLYCRQEQDAVCLSRTGQERHGINLQRVPHQRTPLTDCIPGRAMLIKESGPQLHHLCQQSGQRLEVVQLDVQQVRQHGVLSGSEPGTNNQSTTAAPIYNDEGAVVGALSVVSAPGLEQGEAIQEAANRISMQMGWQGPAPN
jgi:DNA-binding IclR family transcriptional regulator